MSVQNPAWLQSWNTLALEKNHWPLGLDNADSMLSLRERCRQPIKPIETRAIVHRETGMERDTSACGTQDCYSGAKSQQARRGAVTTTPAASSGSAHNRRRGQ